MSSALPRAIAGTIAAVAGAGACMDLMIHVSYRVTIACLPYAPIVLILHLVDLRRGFRPRAR